MNEKGCYAVPSIEIILYPVDDIVRTSRIDSEVGEGWDNEGWGE